MKKQDIMTIRTPFFRQRKIELLNSTQELTYFTCVITKIWKSVIN